MRPHAHSPIDPAWVRLNMGKPKFARRLMARSTGAVLAQVPSDGRWPGGEILTAPDSGDGTPVLLYLHGGGFIACSPETHRPLVGALVRRLSATAFVPKYRLAPEHPFPGAFDDAREAYMYLIEDRKIDSRRIAIVGDSAGGGLALSLVMSLRNDGISLPSSVVMFSPWTDLAASGESLDENSEKCAMFAGDTIRRAARFYAKDADPLDPRLSPLYGSYIGLPPLMMHVGNEEVLRDDTLRVAKLATAAGVDVSLDIWDHVPHVWQFFVAVMPEARRSVELAVEFIARKARLNSSAA